MSEGRKKPGVAFWATVVVVVAPLLYVASFGPACWLVRHDILMPLTAAHIYRPLVNINRLPSWAWRASLWYSGTEDDGIPVAVHLANVLRFEERKVSRK